MLEDKTHGMQYVLVWMASVSWVFSLPLLKRKIMQFGSSKPWTEVLQETLGTNKMDASALMEYFRPITTWLEEQNKQSGETLGWPDFEWMPPVPQGYPEDIGKIQV